jgi:hypothetical protein
MAAVICKPGPFAISIAVLLLGHAAAQQQSPRTPKTNREWTALRARARTAEDFRSLSKWSQGQAESCRRKQSDCEFELRESYAHPPSHPLPRNPPREQSLRNLIAFYRGQAHRWDGLAQAQSERAAALAKTTVTNPAP